MSPEPAQVSPVRILIVRLGSLGDLIHTLPAVAALRDAYPEAEIDWVVERAHAELLAMVPTLSRVVVLGDRTVGGWLEVVRALRDRHYDVAIDLQGLVKSAAIARFSGAKRVVGFDRAGLREPAARFFYRETVPVGEGRHVIDKNLTAVEALKKTSSVFFAEKDTRRLFRFPLVEPPSAALEALRAQGIGDFAVLNPGAAWPNKRWPPESFAAVARFIHATRGWTPVVLWGPGEEQIAQDICDKSGGVARRAPATRLADLVAIARAARLFVSGDTGPLHIAGATGTPIVALFGPTSPARNGPWDDRDVSISRYESCSCHYKRTCQRQATWCLAQISVDEVTHAIERRLGPS
jgi:heptosyltransferase-1